MKIPRSALAAVAALLVASASSAQQDLVDTDADLNNDAAMVDPTSADPVGFLNMGRGRLVSITSSEYESIERGEWPITSSKPGEEMNPDAEATAIGTAVVLSQDEITGILNAHNTLRAKHGAPALTWDTTSAKHGDNWLKACVFKHSHGKVIHSFEHFKKLNTIACFVSMMLFASALILTSPHSWLYLPCII
jgi:hypothetical protein